MRPVVLRLLVVYSFLSVCHLVFIATGVPVWIPLTKFLLIPVLLTAWITATRLETGFSRLVAAALAFCWLGDILLTKDDLFIYGLAAFLTGHIFYILAVVRIKGKGLLQYRPYLVLPVIVYFIGLMKFLFPYLHELRIPVILYATVIGMFLLLCLNTFGKTDRKTAGCFAAGATLFVLSDSLLAINKFAVSIQWSGIWVMTTYCTAQFLLVYAAILYGLSVKKSIE